MKILDCTLRDGGYYNDWDFDSRTVDCYLAAMNRLPVDMIEVGYRSLPSKSYMGRFGYSPRFELERLRERTQKQVAVMFNEKDIRVGDLPTVLDPVADLVDMVRMAIAPDNMARAIELGRAIKGRGIAVAFNVMYMSKWHEMTAFLGLLPQLDGWVDCINMVDSFGGVTPDDVRRTFAMVRERTSVPIGFHGHNNLELALINTLTAIECGAEWVDATVLGMGRGAGNLKLELLLTFLNKQGLEVDFNVLGEVVSRFSELHSKYGWGASLPYMLSGANSLPQKEVMAWVSNRLLSLNSIVRALENKRLGVEDNDKFPEWQAERAERVLVVGGGERVAEHIEAVRTMLKADPRIVVVHASSRYAKLFKQLPNPQI
ncbi:MAG: aldolase catalytic domain-containing protein, partial [Rikenellaceae bacterium]|nr:aldolase catalytic domain-containing protein [Rikenellaceae bacterium]